MRNTYCVVAGDGHVVEGRFFGKLKDAKVFQEEYDGHCVSFVDNETEILKLTGKKSLENGTFPYEKLVYAK